MGTPCSARGMAVEGENGPCGTISLDLAVKMIEAAEENARIQADQDCDPGCKCKGTFVPDGPPVCRPDKYPDGTPYHLWILTGEFQGECVCKGEKAPAIGGCGGKQFIKAKNLRDFFKEVEKLPELPKDPPKGNCQPYKQNKGHGFSYPVCAGACTPAGPCKTTVNVTKELVTLCCDCPPKG